MGPCLCTLDFFRSDKFYSKMSILVLTSVSKTNTMLLDNLVTDFLMKKNVSVKNIKLGLSVVYIFINILLYYKVFYKMNSTWIGLALFLLVTIPFGYLRSAQLNKYINKRDTTQ